MSPDLVLVVNIVGKLIQLYYRTFLVFFFVCHHNCKVIEVVNDAIFVIWCLFEYMNLVETPNIISELSLEIHCKMGLRFYVSPCILFHILRIFEGGRCPFL